LVPGALRAGPLDARSFQAEEASMIWTLAISAAALLVAVSVGGFLGEVRTAGRGFNSAMGARYANPWND
jgi:hypothetical protein